MITTAPVLVLDDLPESTVDRVRALANTLAHDLNADQLGGEATTRFIERAESSYFDQLLEAITGFEIDSPGEGAANERANGWGA